MTNFLMDSTDLQIFDEHGNFITEIKHNIRTHVSIDAYTGTFAIENCLLDLNLLKSFGEKEDSEEVSDFEKEIKEKKTSIKFKRGTLQHKKYKIVSKGILYDANTEIKSHKFNIVLYNAILKTPIVTEAIAGEGFTPSYVFKLEEDERGNFVDLDLFEV